MNLNASGNKIMNMIRYLTLATAMTAILVRPALADPTIPENCKVGDFFAGSQAWTFHEFTAFEAIEKTAAAGGKTIELYPDQKFSPAEPALKLNHYLSDENIAKLKAELDKYGIRAVSYGVVVGTNEADWRQIFEFAKKMNFYGITTDTTDAIKDLDLIEKLVREFDLHVGIHDHPKQPRDPNYRNWDPNFVYAQVKDRDPRIGACADTGHWQTLNMDPLECIKIMHGRIISLHLKDRTQPGPEGHDTVYGTGTGKIAAILQELKDEGFKGHVDVEFEYDEMNNQDEVKRCLDFVRDFHPK
jgi:sugar phosphate isomerase/epimerase